MGQEERRVAAEGARGDGGPGDAAGGPGAPPVAPAQGASPARRGLRAARQVAETVVIALVVYAVVRLVVANYRVDGPSMLPNLRDDQMLLVNVNAYAVDLNRVLNLLPGVEREGDLVLYEFDPPARGDVVVFAPPGGADQPYIKRVIGLPGEEVTIAGGAVAIDGARLDEPYLADPEGGGAVRTPCGQRAVCRATVGEGQVFVLGDNRRDSVDSREFGPVDVEDVVGKAWFTYWPVDDVGTVPHEEYAGLPARPAATPTPPPT